MKHGGAEIRWGAVVLCSGTAGWSPRRGRSLGGSSCRPLQGCAREGVGGAFGGGGALLGRSRGLLFRSEGAGQGSIAGRGAFALQLLGGGGNGVGLLLGGSLGDLVILDGTGGGSAVLPVVGRGGRHGRGAQHSRAGRAVRGRRKRCTARGRRAGYGAARGRRT